jgi:ribosomal protein S18 acetylase RimI-like enzyme
MIFKQVESVEDIRQARELFEEYSVWLGVDLCFQNFEKELRDLPGEYAPPDGRLFLAIEEEQLAGCIAIRRIGPDTCEMKRLFVRPDFRGQGLGRELAITIIEEARAIGFKRMRLDTLPRMMAQALKVYRSLGFKEIEPYYSNPIVGTLYMELAL